MDAIQMRTTISILCMIALSSIVSCVNRPAQTTKQNELLASEVLSADVDFEMETGSFLLKYVMKDGSKRTIVLECPDVKKDETPRILLRGKSNTIAFSEVFSEQDFKLFIRKRLMEGDVSKEEAGFIAVSVLSFQRIASVQGWGFSSAAIMNGDWQNVFSKPVSGLSGPKGVKER